VQRSLIPGTDGCELDRERAEILRRARRGELEPIARIVGSEEPRRVLGALLVNTCVVKTPYRSASPGNAPWTPSSRLLAHRTSTPAPRTGLYGARISSSGGPAAPHASTRQSTDVCSRVGPGWSVLALSRTQHAPGVSLHHTLIRHDRSPCLGLRVCETVAARTRLAQDNAYTSNPSSPPSASSCLLEEPRTHLLRPIAHPEPPQNIPLRRRDRIRPETDHPTVKLLGEVQRPLGHAQVDMLQRDGHVWSFAPSVESTVSL